ncbi:tRNA (cytidine(56)-2'-O)-methyltransferase [Methanolapillus ohkumae]|uniref:tRNA (cytidine(56)-2'-O)-methyltransferase n=1 Tax=Methanolapillus ohkumae TaxID=3028298 RepID=UPI0030B8A67F
MKEIVILRLGHRPERDKRITTHVGLTARALGAAGMILASDDPKIEENILEISPRWGGSFFIKNNANAMEEINQWKKKGGKVCHLSMYGINLPEAVPILKSEKKLMFIVGAEKVPGEIYEISDWNVAVGNQPHSEVAALAIAMDRISDSDPLLKTFENAELTVIPMEKGKKVVHDNELIEKNKRQDKC